MDNEKIEGKSGEATAQTSNNVIILADTSWVVAVLDEKDSHHISAESSLGALLPYKPSFHVPVLAALETMSKLIRVNKISVKKCRKKILDLLGGKLHAYGRRPLNFSEILARYEGYSRKDMKSLTAIDFCIATEGIGLGAKILTCDLKMYKIVKRYYDEIYFMSDIVDAQKSDLARLIHSIQIR
ncbi:MAG: hypothetical protein AAB608_01510 [Patescibacteria group bacterium]